MSAENILIKIIDLCKKIGETGVIIYSNLAKNAENKAESGFWNEMSKDLEDHIPYLEHTINLAIEGMMPQVFHEPVEILSELEKTRPPIEKLLQQSENDLKTSDAFLLAYRLEFFMAYQAFERLFQFIRNVEGKTHSEEYGRHIEKLIDFLHKNNSATLEQELISDTLLRMWDENRRLTIQSQKDPLTGLWNRRGFYEITTPLMHLAKREENSVALMIMDIDNFRELNATYGHQKGDEVLMMVSNCLRSGIRRSDIPARFGGDDFIVFFPNIDTKFLLKTGKRVAELIRLKSKTVVPTTVSIGICHGEFHNTPEREIEQFIRAASSLMTASKASDTIDVCIGVR